jgi:biofilm PGA synthesis lipoprotein PgaB
MKALNRIVAVFLLCLYAAMVPVHAAQSPSRLIVLCYHEVEDDAAMLADPYAVDVKLLAQQLSWLQGHGFHFVSVDQVLAARQGGAPLPDKAVLLSFDDGYRSAYTKVFPVLKQYQAPAVMALVGSWLTPRDDQEVRYGDQWVPRNRFLTWAQIREMQASGLVEFANHSYAMHKGIVANPQGNSEPALSSLAWDHGRYERSDEFETRVRNDLKRNSDLILAETGKSPRVMVWPYGSYNQPAARIAGELGMPVTMSLESGVNSAATPLSGLHRMLMDARTLVPDLAAQMREMLAYPEGGKPAPTRIMHIDLDYIYDPDPKVTESNLGRLLDRVQAMGVSTVYLQAYADPDGKGEASALYFPNRHLPMRADLFNRVAWQLQTRCGVRVYAWMPLLAFRLPAAHPVAGQLVLAASRQGGAAAVQNYHRLSPYSPAARQVIRDIYQDLAQYSHFRGLLFHDDATLSDDEDVSPAALAHYRAQGLNLDPAAWRHDPAQLARWTADKIRLLDDFSLDLAAIVRSYQPDLRTARNYYAPVVLQPESATWFAQSFATGLRNYDFVAVMAMPYMEKAARPKQWMRDLFQRVSAVPGALDKTVFELQSVDWRTARPVPTSEMVETVLDLNTQGARHIAYYPDDLFKDQPRLASFKRVFSMRALPLQ